MSWIAVRKVLELDLPSTEKLVLLIIANFSNDKEGTAWPAQSTIAQITGFSRQTVNKAINRLCDKKVLLSSRRSAEGKSTSNVYRINIVALRDTQTSNVAQNDNQVSNSATNQCNGELHKPLLTLNEPLNDNIDPTLSIGKKTNATSGPPKTPEDFLCLSNFRKEHYALNHPELMRNLRSQGLVWDRFNTTGIHVARARHSREATSQSSICRDKGDPKSDP